MEPTSSIESVSAELFRVLEDLQIEVTGSINGDDWEARISTATIPEDQELHRSALCDEFRDNPWEWCYQFEDDALRIVITLYDTDTALVSADETSIDSPNLSGQWWAPVKDVKVDNYEFDTRVSFIPSTHFPVLIRGGANIDPLSAHFLALLSITALRDARWFERWLIIAAQRGEQNSQQVLGLYYVGLNKPELLDLAAYWLARCALEHDDEKAKLALATLIVSGQTEVDNAPLAEHILCDLCKAGKPDAFLQLGSLLLKGGKGVPADVERGVDLLTVAVEKFNIPEAAEVLKDWDEKDWSILDVCVVVSVGAALMAIGYGIYRRFKK